MDYKNPILLFDWESDIQNTPAPRRATFELKAARIDEDGLPRGIDYEPYVTVQADPLDVITIAEEGDVKKRFHMHPALWMHTLDEYINQYFRLSELLDATKNSSEWIEVTLPDDVIHKLKNQIKEVKHKRKRLDVDTSFFRYAGNNALVGIEGDRYITPRLGAAVYINSLCRSLCTPTNATKKKLSLAYDGQKFGKTEFIPNFTLVDYYWHEAITGISLSIEITAILLEVYNNLPIEDLWKTAFGEFCEKALPIIVRSRMFFTRNTVARSFFQQIYMEQTIYSYEWEGKERYSWKNHSYWESVIERALIPCGFLKSYPYEPDIPVSELESSVSHLWELIKKVETPICFAEYIDNPTYGLAIFCNPKHKYVLPFLNELGQKPGEKKTAGVKPDKKKTARVKPYERKVFTEVHKAVKAAMMG